MTEQSWTHWNPNMTGPKPDMQSIQVKSCFACKGKSIDIRFVKMPNGGIQFKAFCLDCGNKSGAIPYAKDLDSLGETMLPYGKHKGKTLSQVYSEAPDYLDWCVSALEDIKLLGTIVLYLRLKHQTKR